ncbi:ABC-type uncharacterized transport system permease subunit [Brevibacterium paucivorans]|uniref:ABC-type uncharacterized transport system permease subunit n=2 Tax=Brevibacterium TaxID=1696 RepID=A0ABS2SK00_9MICO|nr:ABC-type uncharacterized transport system permease subunit [Brevibacterium paucivorans]
MNTLTKESQMPTALQPVEWKYPIVYGVLAVIAFAAFGLGAPGDAQTTFAFTAPDAFLSIPDLVVASKVTAIVVGVILLALAGFSLWATRSRAEVGVWLPLVFGVLFVFAFLTWAGAGRGVIATTSLLAGGLALSVPLIFGAMCGLVGERSGIINIAIEGQLLAGAFLAAVVASVAKNPYVGLIAAPLAGAIVGSILVFFAVKYWVNQIIIGVVLNVLVVGLTNFLFSTLLTQNQELWNSRQALPALPIPLLSEIPVIGPVFFKQNILV